MCIFPSWFLLSLYSYCKIFFFNQYSWCNFQKVQEPYLTIEENLAIIISHFKQWNSFFYLKKNNWKSNYLLYFVCLLINSNEISVWLCYYDEAADTFPLEYLFLLLFFFLCSAVLGLLLQISPNRNFNFTIPGSLHETTVVCAGRQLHPDGQRFPLREFIQWVGFLFYFFNNAVLVIATQQWLHSKTSFWRKHLWWG